jgi:hypothetical protein
VRSSGVTVQGSSTLYYLRPLLSLHLPLRAFGINGSATLVPRHFPSLFTLPPSSGPPTLPTVFAMLASLVDILAFPFMSLRPILVICFSCYIVISGPHLSLVFLVTNIILLFLMIIHIIYECSPYALNPTLFSHCRTFSPMSTLNLVFPFKDSRATMDANSTILVLDPFLLPTAYFFACHAHTIPPKMAKPNASFAPLTMSFAPYYFMRVFHISLGCCPRYGNAPSQHSSH